MLTNKEKRGPHGGQVKSDFCGFPFQSGFLKWIHGLCYAGLAYVFYDVLLSGCGSSDRSAS